MTEGALVWFVIGGIAACLFFGIAAVVAFRGFGELRDLMTRPGDRKNPDHARRSDT
jgi:hypothetical protein